MNCPYNSRPSKLAIVNPQLVRQAEIGSGETRVPLGLLPVELVRDNAHQPDVAVLHDDVNGRQRLVAVAEENRIAVNRPRHAHSDLVVKVRRGEDFEVVFKPRHAPHVSKDVAEVALLERLSDLARDHQRVAIGAKLDIVEDRIARVHHDLVPSAYEHLGRLYVLGVYDEVVLDLLDPFYLASSALGVELGAEAVHAPRERRNPMIIGRLNL